MRLLKFGPIFTAVLLWNGNCVPADDNQPASAFAADAGCRGEPVADGGSTEEPASKSVLCLDVSSVEAREIFVHTRGEGEVCDQDMGDSVFMILRDEPIRVFLYGLLSHRYCIEMRRVQGYLTLSHRDGTVTREGDIFTWCVDAEERQPQEATARSLTAQAEFMLVVP